MENAHSFPSHPIQIITQKLLICILITKLLDQQDRTRNNGNQFQRGRVKELTSNEEQSSYYNIPQKQQPPLITSI